MSKPARLKTQKDELGHKEKGKKEFNQIQNYERSDSVRIRRNPHLEVRPRQ